MKLEFEVENIKCGGCAHSIEEALMRMSGISEVKVDIENEKIELTASESQRDNIIETLTSLGYPPKGNNNILYKGKSYISCAIGKIKS